MSESKSEVRERFQAQIKALTDTAAAVSAAATNLSAQTKWFTPDLGDWDGDLQNTAAIASAFDRDENAEDVIKAYTDDGVSGDITAGQIQGDVLAAMERAYRARHSSSVRAKLHAVARLEGHVHENGPINGAIAGYVTRVLERAKLNKTAQS